MQRIVVFGEEYCPNIGENFGENRYRGEKYFNETQDNIGTPPDNSVTVRSINGADG